MKLKFAQNGASTVEFAMILPFLLVILFGIMEFGMMIYDKAVITNASREAARSGITYITPKLTTAQIQTVAMKATQNPATNNSLLISCQLANTTVLPSPTPTTSGSSLTVKVSCPYTFFVFGNLYNLYMNGSISNNKLDISATTVMNMQ